MKKLIKNILSLRWLAWCIGYFLPIKKNRIFVCVNSGSGYSDNAKYIVNELLKSNEELEVYWVTSNEKAKASLPTGVKNARFNKFSSIIKMLTSSVWIDNSRKTFVYKKKKTLYIQTWHGGGIYKKVEKAVEDNLPKNYIKIAKKDSKAIDVFLSDCKLKTKNYYEDFWYDGYVLETSSPRNDIIINSLKDKELEKGIKDKVYKFFNISLDKSIILYAPTFRSNENLDVYKIDYERLIETCNKKFEKDYVVVVRLHPNIAHKCDFIEYNEKILNGSLYFDSQELLVATLGYESGIIGAASLYL